MSEIGDGSGAGDTAPITIYDIQAAEESKVRVRALPRLTRQALRLAWAPGELISRPHAAADNHEAP